MGALDMANQGINWKSLRLTVWFACLLTFGISLPPAFAEDFFAQVMTYDEIKANDTQQKMKMQAFEEQVQKDTPPKYTPISKDFVRIVVVFPGNQVSDYWRRALRSMEARLDQANVKYTTKALFADSKKELRKQELYIYDELRGEPDYMLFTLDALRHKTVIERIIGLKQTKLILQNITTPIRTWKLAQPFLYSGFDHAVGSRRLADEYLKSTSGVGNYAVFYGPAGYVSQMRGDTFIKYMKKNSKLKMVKSYYVGFNREKAKAAALHLFEQTTDLQFIYACSTDIALGIIDALKEKNLLGKIKVNGWGGGSAELESLEKGEMDFTIMRMNDDNGAAVADAIILDQSGKGDSVPIVYSGEMQLVTKEASQSTVNKLKQRAFRYSN